MPSKEALWRDLCEKDDRTSPEDYPDMALITEDEFYSCLDAFATAAEVRARNAAIEELTRLRDALEEIASDCDPADPEWGNPALGRRNCWDVTQRALATPSPDTERHLTVREQGIMNKALRRSGHLVHPSPDINQEELIFGPGHSTPSLKTEEIVRRAKSIISSPDTPSEGSDNR